MAKPTLEDLLNSLQSPRVESKERFLDNNKDTWNKIGSKRFNELGLDLEGSELDEFIKEWTKDNSYNNI